MQPLAPLHPAESFALFMGTVLKAVCDTLPIRFGPFQGRLWSRLMRLRNRFAHILAKARAGHYENTKPCPPRQSPRKPPEPPPPPQYPHLVPPPLPPGGFPALLRLLPEFYAYRGVLEHMLAQPDMQELLKSTPRLRRAINPLCRMFRLKSPADPSRPPRQATAAEPSSPPKPRRIFPARRRPTQAAPPQEPEPSACDPPYFPMIGVWPPEIISPITIYLNAMKTRQ